MSVRSVKSASDVGQILSACFFFLTGKLPPCGYEPRYASEPDAR